MNTVTGGSRRLESKEKSSSVASSGSVEMTRIMVPKDQPGLPSLLKRYVGKHSEFGGTIIADEGTDDEVCVEYPKALKDAHIRKHCDESRSRLRVDHKAKKDEGTYRGDFDSSTVQTVGVKLPETGNEFDA